MASQDTAVVLSSDDEEEGAATSGVPSKLNWVRAEHALKELPPLSNPSSQPRAQKGKGRFINRCTFCITSCNGVTDSHMRWLNRHGIATELNVTRGQKLDILDIVAYGNSFGYAFFPCKKRKRNRSNSVTMLVSGFASSCCVEAIQRKQTGESPPEGHCCQVVNRLIRLWLDKFSQYIFIPLLVGKVKRSRHFVAAAVAIKQRKIYFYDSAKVYGLRSATTVEKDILVPLRELTFAKGTIYHQGKVIVRSDAVPDLKIISEQALAIDDHCNPRPNPDEPDKRWRFQFVNEFVYQENDVECGLFVCFFFECVARRIKLTVRKNIDRGAKLDDYRKWVAFSTCYGRMCRIADNIQVQLK
jgi:hypothetical protein